MRNRIFLWAALALLGVTASGCINYSHTRDQATGLERTRLGAFLVRGKASQINSAVKDGPYSRKVAVGAIEGQGDAELFQALYQAGVETGKKSAGVP